MDRMLFANPEAVPTRWSWWRRVQGGLGGLGSGVHPTLVPRAAGGQQGPRLPGRSSGSRASAPDVRGLVRPPLPPRPRRRTSPHSWWALGPSSGPDFARLALILDQLEWAYGRDESGLVARPDVGPESVAGAIRLVDDYFKPHFRRTIAAMRPVQANNADAKAILAWAVNRDKPRFSEARGLQQFPAPVRGPSGGLPQGDGLADPEERGPRRPRRPRPGGVGGPAMSSS